MFVERNIYRNIIFKHMKGTKCEKIKQESH